MVANHSARVENRRINFCDQSTSENVFLTVATSRFRQKKWASSLLQVFTWTAKPSAPLQIFGERSFGDHPEVVLARPVILGSQLT